MKTYALLIVLGLLLAACGPAPIEERLYRVCNDQPQPDAIAYSPSETVRVLAVEKFTMESNYADDILSVREGPLEQFLSTIREAADVSLVLCVNKRQGDIVYRCPYQGNQLIGYDATYTYSLRVAQTGEELVTGDGELIYENRDPLDRSRCPRSMPSSMFADGDLLRTPPLSADSALFDTLEPFLTAP